MSTWARLAVAALAVGVASAPPSLTSSPSPTRSGLPTSMAATGDSITRAYNTGPDILLEALPASWSTGSSTEVGSHYLRLLATEPRIKGKSFNDARSGARMAQLPDQVTAAASQRVEYVTILMGANDLCAPHEGLMTPVADFRAQFEGAMAVLATRLPDARVFVASIPNLHRLWEVLKDTPAARAAWATFGICQSMLANPLSTEPPDEQRRQRVWQRNVDYNAQLGQVCAAYAHCRFDGNAVFDHPFDASHVSTHDYFHPSLHGQRTLADVTWKAGFDFTDRQPQPTGRGHRQG